MADETKIEWADSTFNPWIGCTKISPACDHCYAEDWAKRFGQVKWGNHPRKRTSVQTWNKVHRWHQQADQFEAEHGRPRFVFVASLADVFDNQVPLQWRRDLWDLIAACDRLVFLLLTKRPQNIRNFLPAWWGEGLPNVWLGTTVENQEVADRNIPHLLAVPAAKRFLSIEPMLGPVDLKYWLEAEKECTNPDCSGGYIVFVEDTYICGTCDGSGAVREPLIDWVIAGGESGPNARPSHPDWFRSLRNQCAEADVPFLFKQWGEWVPSWECLNVGRSKCLTISPNVTVAKVGKAKAGRVLDGTTHDGRPEA